MANAKNYDKPVAEGFTKADNYIRCPKCVDRPALAAITISLKRPTEPNVPLAIVQKCSRPGCGWVLKRFVIQGFTIKGEDNVRVPPATEQYGITVDMLRRCLDIAPRFDSFTEEELRSGVVHGVDNKPRIQYNPDEFIEQQETLL